MEELSHVRPVSDRKRKFVDTELAQDTEGKRQDVYKQFIISAAITGAAKIHHVIVNYKMNCQLFIL